MLSQDRDGRERERSQGLPSDKSLRLVFEAAPTGMILVNQDGRIALVNSQAEMLFGYARDEMLGQPLEILVPQWVTGLQMCPPKLSANNKATVHNPEG